MRLVAKPTIRFRCTSNAALVTWATKTETSHRQKEQREKLWCFPELTEAQQNYVVEVISKLSFKEQNTATSVS